jgi:iron complex outermembrane receptor protein
MVHSNKRLILSVCMLISTGAIAQESTRNNEALLETVSEKKLDTVVISADRHGSSINELAISITPLDQDTIDRINASHINEVLAQVPGTWISRGNGQEHLTAIRSAVLTGAGSCGAFQMSQDGIPLRAAGFCNVNQLFESNYEQATAIEVIRGPGSVLYGANALHGTINVISQGTTDNLTGNLQLEGGPHDYQRLKSSISNRFGKQGIRINTNGTKDGGYKDDSGFDQQKIDVIHEFTDNGLQVTTILNASNLNQETAGYIEGFEAYKDDSLKKENPNPEAFRDANSLRLHSEITWQQNDSRITVTPYYRKTAMDFLMHFLPGTPLEENGQESLGLQSLYSTDLNKDLALLVGTDVEITKAFLRQTQADTLKGDSGFLNATLPQGKQYDFEVEAKLISPYLQLTYDIDLNNQLTAGLRYEYLHFNYDNKLEAGRLTENGNVCGFGGCRYSRPDDREDSFDNSSIQLAWLHTLHDHSQTFINLSRAFRAPQANELYRLQNTQTVADLDSEKINSLELGYRNDFDPISISLSAYYMNKSDVIFQNSDRENISGGKTQHQGIELESQIKLSHALTLNIAASYNEHTYTKDIAPRGVTVNIDGNYLDTAPKLMGNIQVHYQINQQQHAQLEWVHLGPYYTDEANHNKYDGHDLFNVRYQINLSHHWQGALRITNVLDADYAERADYAFGKHRYFVGEPRSLYGSIAYAF